MERERERNIIPSIRPTPTAPLIIILASPTAFVIIRTSTTAPAAMAIISYLSMVPITVISVPAPAATSPPVIPIPILILIPEIMFLEVINLRFSLNYV